MAQRKIPNTELYVISDVHNQLGALQRLLEKIPEEAKLVYVGDLVHKGPVEDCEKLVDFVKAQVDSGRAICISGNHDSTVGKGKGRTQEGTLRDDQREWLRSLPLLLRKDGVVYVHGGMYSSTSKVLRTLIETGYLPKEGDWTPEMVEEALRSVSKKNLKTLGNMRYVRFVDSDTGKMVSFGHEKPTDVYWATKYDGEFGTVVFGHNPWVMGPAVFAYAVGIDSGAGVSEFEPTHPFSVGATVPTISYGKGLMAVPVNKGVIDLGSVQWVEVQA